MGGKLIGVGVGPGDPELVTLKACRYINETRYIAFPGLVKEENQAYKIVESLIEEPESKIFIDCYVQMTKDRAVLDMNYDKAAAKLMDILDKGENVVMLTIGDPTIYATYMYIHERIAAKGYDTEIVSGIPSFCAAAARLQISLCEREQQLHIIPSSYDIEDALCLPGNKVLMKAASRLKEVREQLIDYSGDTFMIEKCGMKEERIFKSAGEIDPEAGYLSVIIVKDKQNEN